MAKAIASGRATTPTINPAWTSATSWARVYVLSVVTSFGTSRWRSGSGSGLNGMWGDRVYPGGAGSRGIYLGTQPGESHGPGAADPGERTLGTEWPGAARMGQKVSIVEGSRDRTRAGDGASITRRSMSAARS